MQQREEDIDLLDKDVPHQFLAIGWDLEMEATAWSYHGAEGFPAEGSLNLDCAMLCPPSRVWSLFGFAAGHARYSETGNRRPAWDAEDSCRCAPHLYERNSMTRENGVYRLPTADGRTLINGRSRSPGRANRRLSNWRIAESP